MSTTYQNWQNASNTTEQYLTAAMMLERAEADDVLMEAFKEFPHDAKSGRSLRMPRWAVPAVNTTPVSEGINNAIRNLVPENVYVTLSEYQESFGWTSQAENMDPLDYAAGAAEVGHDLVKRDRTALKWAEMTGGTQVIYNSSSLSARNTVNGVITAGRIDQAISILHAAKAKAYADLQLGSNKIGSSGLMSGYLAYGHTDLLPDIEALRNYIPVSNYPSDVRKNPNEVGAGASGRCRFILSSELTPIADSGAAASGTNLRSTSGTSVDVYPIVIVGQGALACVPLRKRGTSGKGNLTVHQINTPDRSDPGNLTRIWSAVWTEGYVVTNELWMIRVEVACTDAYS